MIHELEKVDLLTMEKDIPALLCLGITDEIQWEHHIEEHLLLLQEKLNNYVTFVLNQGYKAALPGKVFRDFLIKIYFAYQPNETAQSFLQQYQRALQKDGMAIRIDYEIVPPTWESCEAPDDSSGD